MTDLNGSSTVPSTEETETKEEHSESYQQLLDSGLSTGVANALDKVFKQDLVKFSDLDERALEALKELDEEGALAVLKQFNESNLQHVQNKSAFLCGVMKIHRQKVKQEKTGATNSSEESKTGPSDDKVKELLDRTKYSLDVTTGQRKYGGPPPKEVYDGSEPGNGCQVFVGRIPRTIFEDELVPLLEQAGTIWDFRLMMDPLSGQNRGFGFVTYVDKDHALECVKKWDNYEIRPKKFLGVCVSQSNCRLFVGSIPKSKTKDEIFNEFDTLSTGLKDVIIYAQTEDKTKNRGFCFLEYADHKTASQARRKLSSPKVKAFNNAVSVDWADPIDQPSDEVMSKVKVLYVKNLSIKATEEVVMTTFSAYGEVERVKKIKDYAFVHFKERENAMKALEELNGLNLEGDPIEISLAKPVDKKRKEKQMERKMMNTNFGYGQGNSFGGRGGRGSRGGGGGGMGGGGYRGAIQNYGGYGGGGYGNDYFADDYMNYGFGGGYEDQYYGGYHQRPQGMMRGRGMYGGGAGGGFGRGRGGRGRGRGGRGGGSAMSRGRGKSGLVGNKRKANFGDNSNAKRQNQAGGGDSQWGSEPIAQQPLNQGSNAQWFQDSVDQQWS